MLNIIDSNNLSIKPMNYYLTFAASDGECDLELAVRVNQSQAPLIADALLLGLSSQYHIDIPWKLPVEITRTTDAGDGVNSMSENLSSKLGWLSIANDTVTLFVAGFNHAVRIPYALFYNKLSELYESILGGAHVWMHWTLDQPRVGAVTIEGLGRRMVVRHKDLMLIGSYSPSGVRNNSQPIMVYQQDVEGLWLYVEPVTSARYARFVSNTKELAI